MSDRKWLSDIAGAGEARSFQSLVSVGRWPTSCGLIIQSGQPKHQGSASERREPKHRSSNPNPYREHASEGDASKQHQGERGGNAD